jgi:hypothetical protein
MLRDRRGRRQLHRRHLRGSIPLPESAPHPAEEHPECVFGYHNIATDGSPLATSYPPHDELVYPSLVDGNKRTRRLAETALLYLVGYDSAALRAEMIEMRVDLAEWRIGVEKPS